MDDDVFVKSAKSDKEWRERRQRPFNRPFLNDLFYDISPFYRVTHEEGDTNISVRNRLFEASVTPHNPSKRFILKENFGSV